MIDEVHRKMLFDAYAKNCKQIQISNKDSKVVDSQPIDVDSICIDKNGKVSVQWYTDSYNNAIVDEINYVGLFWIKGVFTSEDKAIEIAKNFFKRQKLKKIVELEDEIAKLKNELEAL